MQRDRLEQEREDHQDEAQQPDAAAQRVSQKTQSQCGIGGRVLHAHALEDAGERIGYRSAQSTDEDHVSLVRLERLDVSSGANSLYSTHKYLRDDGCALGVERSLHPEHWRVSLLDHDEVGAPPAHPDQPDEGMHSRERCATGVDGPELLAGAAQGPEVRSAAEETVAHGAALAEGEPRRLRAR